MTTNPQILDACCGGRMMWYNKTDPDILAQDIRRETVHMTDNGTTRTLQINPHILADFRQMPYPDNTYPLILLDPPHLIRAGQTSWLRKKYGILDKNTWQQDITAALAETWRILAHSGTLVFKWNTCQIPKKAIEQTFPAPPKFITRVGKTYTYIFFKK